MLKEKKSYDFSRNNLRRIRRGNSNKKEARKKEVKGRSSSAVFRNLLSAELAVLRGTYFGDRPFVYG